MKIDPKRFDNFSRVLTGVVVPRPIALISTVSADGVANLAPFSYFNAVADDPPTIVVGISRQADWKDKDTLVNIERTGEFVVNVVVTNIAEQMNSTAAEYPAEVDEFQVSGLTPVASDVVSPPRVAESPVNMECRLDQVVSIGSADNQHGLVIGNILLVHIWDELIDGHRVNHDRLDPVGRLAGNMYTRTDSTYELIRPVYRPEWQGTLCKWYRSQYPRTLRALRHSL